MKALVARCYGAPDVLTLEQVAKPTPADDQLLVKVHAAALNPVDWHYMRGSPYIMRLSSGVGAPKDARIGVDFAGTVEAVGKNVTRFKPGDEVFGGANGAVGGVRGRSRDPRRCAQACQRDFRAGGLSCCCCTYGAAGPARPWRHRAGTESPDQRRIGRRRHVRRTDRQALRRRSHRRVQHAERRAGSLARRRPRGRLHPGRLRREQRALRHHPGQRRQSLALRSASRAAAERCAGHRRRCQGRLDRTAHGGHQGDRRAAVRRSESRFLHRRSSSRTT